MPIDAARQNPVGSEGSSGLWERFGLQLRQFLCGLHGHDALLHFEEGRLSLLCASCGHETPGWDLSANAPPKRGAGMRRPPVARLPLVGERRVA